VETYKVVDETAIEGEEIGVNRDIASAITRIIDTFFMITPPIKIRIFY